VNQYQSDFTIEYIRVFRALTDENRMRILRLLCGGELCAYDMLGSLDISQPTLSHHMKILCESNIVSNRKAGKWQYYSINDEGCARAGALVQKLLQRDMD
jgi:ArsR family transcriptional regulator